LNLSHNRLTDFPEEVSIGLNGNNGIGLGNGTKKGVLHFSCVFLFMYL
jgi:hypothetical protein